MFSLVLGFLPKIKMQNKHFKFLKIIRGNIHLFPFLREYIKGKKNDTFYNTTNQNKQIVGVKPHFQDQQITLRIRT